MTLEDAISKLAHEIALNTLAVKQNTLVRNGGKPFTAEQQQADIEQKYEESKAATKTEEVIQKAKKPTPVKTEELVSSANGASPQSEPETVAVVTPPILDYKNDIMPVLTKYFTKCGRDAAAALLKTYGVNKFSEIEHSRLDGLLVDLNSGLAS